jgi:two-component system LytT family response regulator
MENLNCIIIDDESHSIDILTLFIGDTPGLNLLKTFSNPVEAIDTIKNELPHITFLDVELPQMSGLEIYNLVAKYTSVIFISAHYEHAVDAYNKDAHDFLLKPFSFERFTQSINKIKKQIAPNSVTDTSFFIKTDKGKLVKIIINEIIFIEGALNYVKFHTSRGDYTTYLTMSEVENLLPRSNILRIHKSFLINTDKIAELDGNTIILDDNSKVQLGITYKDSFFDLIDEKILKSKRKTRS